MSILVGISVVMAFLSMLVFLVAAYECSQSQQSFSVTVVLVCALLAFVVFAAIAVRFGLIAHLSWFDS